MLRGASRGGRLGRASWPGSVEVGTQHFRPPARERSCRCAHSMSTHTGCKCIDTPWLACASLLLLPGSTPPPTAQASAMNVGVPNLQALLAEAATTGVLHLSWLGLHRVPKEVFDLTGLVRLDLGNNDISSLPEQLTADIRELEH